MHFPCLPSHRKLLISVSICCNNPCLQIFMGPFSGFFAIETNFATLFVLLWCFLIVFFSAEFSGFLMNLKFDLKLENLGNWKFWETFTGVKTNTEPFTSTFFSCIFCWFGAFDHSHQWKPNCRETLVRNLNWILWIPTKHILTYFQMWKVIVVKIWFLKEMILFMEVALWLEYH